ncbi:unnamed protein product [Echinostoma caproni]|uniref:G_PROTEIN_RECEP_F1_2 domain-containing protein n=1 Tax=Echinostoma caproni TaxID=27848 RepID=A0A183ADI5_9TREM|nr:unnamed protein product [Echinostoma caproni]
MNQTTGKISWGQSDDNDVDYSYIIACGYVFVQTAICAVGFVLNVINFLVFVQPTFTAPTYIMMTFLSLADAATLGFRIPQGYVFFPIISEYNSDAVLYVYVYSTYVEVPLTNMSENISAWLTVTLAIERYVTMKHWSVAKRFITQRNTRFLVLVIFLVAVVFNTPYFATQVITLSRENGTLELKSELTSFYHTNYYAIYTWLRIVLVQIIPLCFLCISNCLLFALVSQHNQRFSRHEKACGGGTPVKRKSRFLRKRKLSTGSFLTAVSETWALNNEQNDNSSTRLSFSVVHINGNNSAVDVSTPKTDTTQTNMDRPSQGTLKPEVNQLQVPSKKSRRSRHPRDSVRRPSANVDLTPSEPDQRSGKFERSQKRRAAQKKLTILLIAVILLFLIGQVPLSLAYIRVFAALGICSTNRLDQCVAHQFYRMITINLSHLAFALNFFVYLFLNRDFRNTIVRRTCQPKSCIAYPRSQAT